MEGVEDTSPYPNRATASSEPATSRMRDYDAKNVGLERLVAASGFGHFHVVHVKAKQRHMIGRNVTVPKEGPYLNSASQRRRDETNSVGSSYDGQMTMIACRSSIAPIVSASIDNVSGAKVEKDAKRAKHHHHIEQVDRKKAVSAIENAANRKRQPLQLATHYVIQLQSIDDASGNVGSLESLSSNSDSVEAQLLGLSKDDVQRQRMAAGIQYAEQLRADEFEASQHDQHEDLSTAESSATLLHVTAIG